MISGPEPSRIYGIADRHALGSASIPDAVEAMAQSGIRWIQLRFKGDEGARLETSLEVTVRRLEGSETRLWVDDRVDLAALFPVAGVHLGQTDLPPREARELLGPDLWIGRSTHDIGQVEEAARSPEVDVIAVGPVFGTDSKRDADPVVGLGLVRKARLRTQRPLVAIGGIDADNLGRVLEAGADSVAIIGALCRGNVGRNARRLVEAAA